MGRKAADDLSLFNKFVVILMAGLIVSAISNSKVKATNSSVQVKVQIARTHTLIVNDSGNIVKIISNSTNPSPDMLLIRMTSQTGEFTAMSEEIKEQYDSIALNNDLSGRGIVYRQTAPSLVYWNNFLFNSAGLVLSLKKRG